MIKKLSTGRAAALALVLTLTCGQAAAQFDPCADHTFDEISQWMDSLAASNPAATVASYGNSYEGRDLRYLSVRPSTGLPVIVCVGANSPDEWAGIMLVQDLMDEIVQGTDPAFNVLRTWYEVVFIPVMNPDGHWWTWTSDRTWSKSRSQWSPSPCRGVDLDRNWSVCFGGADSSPSPCALNHRGPAPFSEPETSALSGLLASLPNLAAVVDFRAFPAFFGSADPGAVLWPFGECACGTAAACLPPIAAMMSTGTGYAQLPLNLSDRGPASGVMIDWCHATLNVPAFQFYPETQVGWTHLQICQNNRQMLPGLANALSSISACGGPTASACGRWAGDPDNFGAPAGAADGIIERAPFQTWLARPGGNNAAYHGGQPLPFDTAASNWEFGYSFCAPATAAGGRLTVRVRSTGGSSNDAINLQFNGATSSFDWGRRLADLRQWAGGPMAWNAGDTMTLTLDLTALPLSGGGTIDLLPTITSAGHLDVRVQDDTAVDFLELSFCDYPAVGTSCLAATCPACSTMALAAVNTPLECSSSFGPISRFRLELTGAPAGGLAIFVLNFGPCTGGVPLWCGSLYPNPVGLLALPSVPIGGLGGCSGSFSQALGFPCGWQGLTFCAQAAVACPGTFGLGLTNAVEFVIE